MPVRRVDAVAQFILRFSCGESKGSRIGQSKVLNRAGGASRRTCGTALRPA